MAKAQRAVPLGYYTVTPMLTLDDAAGALDWYKDALGAEELSRSVGPDGKIMHAEIRIGDSRIMLQNLLLIGRAAATREFLAPLRPLLRSRSCAARGRVPNGRAARSAVSSSGMSRV